jgi:hypothetical protein
LDCPEKFLSKNSSALTGEAVSASGSIAATKALILATFFG